MSREASCRLVSAVELPNDNATFSATSSHGGSTRWTDFSETSMMREASSILIGAVKPSTYVECKCLLVEFQPDQHDAKKIVAGWSDLRRFQDRALNEFKRTEPEGNWGQKSLRAIEKTCSSS